MTSIIEWLLAGDPAIAWQTERDLLQLPARRYERTRRRVCATGWGARLLERRAPDGLWGGGLYNPKWTSTFYTLQLLTVLGAGSERACVETCQMLLNVGVQPDGSVRLWKGPRPDTCVTGMLLSMSAACGLQRDSRVERMLDWLLQQQMPDGGWNCRWRARQGATHASFHTTTSVLEGLQAWLESPSRSMPEVVRAAARGREFMLLHRLYRSHRTGAVARAEFTQARFPFYWKYDVMRGLDYFRAADVWDTRLEDGLDVLEERRRPSGRWLLPSPHSGRRWFTFEPAGKASRWNTLRALRVLAWAEARRR